MLKKFSLFDKIFKRKFVNKFNNLSFDANNQNVYSEKLLSDFINSKSEKRGRTCANCNFNEISHYYPATEFDVDFYPCDEFEAIHKFEMKEGLDFLYNSGGTVTEKVLLNNIKKKTFENFKLTGLIKTV